MSLVAFRMRGLRLCRGGWLGAVVLRPIATHDLLNVRTYVRHQGEPGIFFMREWIPNRLSIPFGPPAFGLPYRHGRLRYEHRHEVGRLNGEVVPSRTPGRLAYRADLGSRSSFGSCETGSLAEFLLERYTAFTIFGRVRRLFRIWHEPWPQSPVQIHIEDDTALSAIEPWFPEAHLVGATYSPGLLNVQMGRPRWVR